MSTFYNRKKEQPEWEILKLSDAFLKQTDIPQLELECIVVNLNMGMNTELMQKCKVLREYTIFVNKIRTYYEKLPLEKAITKAVDECIAEHVLEEFLKREKAQVISMSVLEFDLEKQLKFAREDGYEEAYQEITQVISELLEEGKIEEILKITQDEAYRNEMLKKYRK